MWHKNKFNDFSPVSLIVKCVFCIALFIAAFTNICDNTTEKTHFHMLRMRCFSAEWERIWIALRGNEHNLYLFERKSEQYLKDQKEATSAPMLMANTLCVWLIAGLCPCYHWFVHSFRHIEGSPLYLCSSSNPPSMMCSPTIWNRQSIVRESRRYDRKTQQNVCRKYFFLLLLLSYVGPSLSWPTLQWVVAAFSIQRLPSYIHRWMVLQCSRLFGWTTIFEHILHMPQFKPFPASSVELVVVQPIHFELANIYFFFVSFFCIILWGACRSQK